MSKYTAKEAIENMVELNKSVVEVVGMLKDRIIKLEEKVYGDSKRDQEAKSRAESSNKN